MTSRKKFLCFLQVKKIVAAISITFVPLEAIHAYSQHKHKTYYIQIGSYQHQRAAQTELKRAQQKIKLKGLVQTLTVNNQVYYKVWLGPFHYAEAKTFKTQIDQQWHSSFLTSFHGDVVASQTNDSHRVRPKIVKSKSEKPNAVSSVSAKPFMIKLPSHFFQKTYPTRALAQGTLAEKTNFFDGDVMLPFIGNNDWIGYLDGEGKYGDDDAWIGSFGLGFRSVKGDNLWGGYVFADRNVSVNDQTFWVINPGIEMLGMHWDAHINGYIPLKKEHSFGIFTGESLHLNTTYFVKHTQFDRLFNTEEITGLGADGEIGYTFRRLHSLRPFIGGYYFNLKNGPHITGVEGGVELPITSNFSFLLRDAYDAVQKNNAMATLRVTLGGIARPINNVRDRMLDPLQRHLGAFQTGSGIPILKINQNAGILTVQDNVWFFNTTSPTLFAGFESCTFENPCGTLNNLVISGIQMIAPNASFFIESGRYLPEAGGFNVFNGQSFYGRQANFFQPAQGINRPIINSLFLNGNNNINNLQVFGNAISPVTQDSPAPAKPILVGIEVATNAAGGVNINHSNILVEGGLGSDKAGIRLLSEHSPLIIQDSTVSGSITNAPSFYSYGIINHTSGFILVNRSVIAASAYNGSGTGNLGAAFGIQNAIGGTISVKNSTINATSISSTDAEGIQNFGNLAIDQSTINTITLNSAASSASLGIFNNSNGIASMSNSIINVSTQETGAHNFIYGISHTNGLFSIMNSQINVSGNNNANPTQLAGIQNDGSTSQFLMSNARINVAAAKTNASLYGI